MTLTTPMCPAAEELPPEPWNPSMMSEAAKLELGML
jgi:metal-sulfur cluster biosynthetic enzyme